MTATGLLAQARSDPSRRFAACSSLNAGVDVLGALDIWFDRESQAGSLFGLARG